MISFDVVDGTNGSGGDLTVRCLTYCAVLAGSGTACRTVPKLVLAVVVQRWCVGRCSAGQAGVDSVVPADAAARHRGDEGAAGAESVSAWAECGRRRGPDVSADV